MTPSPTPPSLPRRLLVGLCRPELAEEVLGDLDESFQKDLVRLGVHRARLRYWREALLFIRPHTLRNSSIPTGRSIMLKNYLSVAGRFMARHKTYSAINLAGLMIGIAVALLIAVFVMEERSVDSYHADADRMYRLTAAHNDSNYDGIAKLNGPWGIEVARQEPSIEAVTRFVFFGSAMADVDGVTTQISGGFYADSTVFDVFSWPLIVGDPAIVLQAPQSIVLTQTLARSLFGSQDPIGRTIDMQGDAQYTVTGLMEDVPRNSHFTFPFLASMSSYSHVSHDDWLVWNQYYTYLKVVPGADPLELGERATATVNNRLGSESGAQLRLQPLLDIYLRSSMFREIASMGSLQTLNLLSAIAAFILLLAGLNFVNLATARATLRAREVGVRKSLGARRSAVVSQFLTESVANVTLAAIAALVLAYFLLPSFNELAGTAFGVQDLLTFQVLSVAALGVIGLGVLAGFYPALVLSGFQPAAVMRGSGARRGGTHLRRALVLVQFVVSITLLMATGIVSDQLRYIQEKPLGFDQTDLVGISLQDATMTDRVEVIRSELEAVPGVESVSFSGNRPGGGDWGIPIQIPGLSDEEHPPTRILVADHAFVETFRMDVAEGRDADPAFPTDAESGVLVNEEFVRQVGWSDPIGQQISMSGVGRDFRVIGVLRDFHFRSAHEAIAPVLLMDAPPSWYSLVNVRLDPNRTEAALAGLEDIYRRYDPINAFSHSFLADRFDSLYQGDERTRLLLRIATLMAFFVACLGLFGLAAHAAERRTKEIGVRKAIGASNFVIVGLLTRETLGLVLVAVALAAPAAVYFGSSWLESFAYRTTIGPATLALGAAAAVAIAMATTGLQALRAARMDPVRALRTE